MTWFYILVLCLVSNIIVVGQWYRSHRSPCVVGNWTGSGPLQVKRTFVGLRTLEHCCFIRFYNGTLISIRHEARILNNYSYLRIMFVQYRVNARTASKTEETWVIIIIVLIIIIKIIIILIQRIHHNNNV